MDSPEKAYETPEKSGKLREEKEMPDQSETTKPCTNSQKASSLQEQAKRYELMVYDLYSYQFGAIGFLDLIEKWEQMFSLAPISPSHHTAVL